MRTFCLLFLLLININNGQVLGIDFGTQFWKAALISPGKNLIIVENVRSLRKTANGITFKDGVRYYQEDAIAKYLKNPQLAYFKLNKVLKSLDTGEEIDGYEYDDGICYIRENQTRIRIQQLVGMILKNIKKSASLQAETEIKDCVITTPSNWGFKAKMALTNAAYLADLSVLGLINENTAAAINFAITRSDSDPKNIVLFNLGSQNLQISVIRFFSVQNQLTSKNIESIKVLNHLVVENIGGYKVDEQIANYLADQFFKKHKIDPRLKPKSFAKLLYKSSQIKETLSANKQTGVYIEGLIDGIDLNLNIKREFIENLPFLLKIDEHIQKCLDEADLQKSDIHSVQLIGGAIRIPLVNKVVKDYFDPIEVGTHMNGDESMALGSALRAANLSIAFRVRQLHLYDGQNKNTNLIINNNNQNVYNQQIFLKDTQHGEKNQIKLNNSEQDLELKLVYGQENQFRKYSLYNISGWKDKIVEDNNTKIQKEPEIVIQVISNSINIAQVKDVYLNITLNITKNRTISESIQVEEEEEEEKEKQKEEEEEKEEEEKNINSSQMDKDSDKVDEKIEVSHDNQEQEEQKISDTENQKTDSSSNLQNNQNEDKFEQKVQEKIKENNQKKKKKKAFKFIDRNITQTQLQYKKYFIKFNETWAKYPKFNEEKLKQLKQTLIKYDQYQNDLQQKSKIRNQLESSLYRLKDQIDGQFLKTFGTQDEINRLRSVVDEKILWMDQNAWTASKQQIKLQVNSLYQAYQPMHNRSQEYQDRQKTYKEIAKFMQTTYQKTLQLNTTHNWLSDLIEKHLKKINQTAQFITQKVIEQSKRNFHEDIVIYNFEMKKKAEDLRTEYYLIKMIPRPKIAKPQSQKSQENETDDQNSSKSNDQNFEKVKQQDNQEEQQEKQLKQKSKLEQEDL